jgi:hypothetical protein
MEPFREEEMRRLPDIVGRGLHWVVRLWALGVVNPAAMNVQREGEGFLAWSGLAVAWGMQWALTPAKEKWATAIRAGVQTALACAIMDVGDAPDAFAGMWTFWVGWSLAALVVPAKPPARVRAACECLAFACWCGWWSATASLWFRIPVQESYALLALPAFMYHPVHVHAAHGALLVVVALFGAMQRYRKTAKPDRHLV